VILAEIGTDMTRFPTAGHLASWARLAQGMKESAGKWRPAPALARRPSLLRLEERTGEPVHVGFIGSQGQEVPPQDVVYVLPARAAGGASAAEAVAAAPGQERRSFP
jgi:Transposase IS116/IS110/IS902 family